MTLIVLVSIKIFAPGAVSGYAPVPAILSAVSFNLVFGLVLGILGDWAEKGDSPRSEKNLYGLESRRDFIFAAGIIVSSIALVGAIARDLLDAIDVGIGTAAGHIPSFFTPNNLFYTVQKDVGTPRLDSLKWSLRIDGLVRNPLLINFEELKAMSSDEQIVTLECIDNPVGGPLISNAKWRGVSLVKILERAGFNNEESLRIVVSGAGNYSDSFPASLLKDRNVMLAIEMNGQVLPPSHGFPARLITPGLYGIKNVKWVERIKVIKGDFEGYWQERGWTYDGTIKTMSKFSVPKNGDSFSENRIRLAGVAFAGARGLTKIEVSDDGGLNWQEAKLEDPVTGEDLSTVTSWRLWVMDWTPSRKGQHLLVVRATDGTGTVQIAELKDVFPDGSSGYHRIRVNVI
ncbi:MAG: molybdopterin-dependent oxidoreductase [Pyrinomonadaceae bacterium]